MKRRMVFLTSIGALHLVACGGEPIETGEEYDETQQALSITPSLLIKSIRFSGTAPGSMIKLSVQVLPDLYLGVITLVNGGPGAPTTGKLAKGTLSLPGFAEATISAELYAFILAEAKVSKLAIELQYDKTVIKNVFIEYV